MRLPFLSPLLALLTLVTPALAATKTPERILIVLTNTAQIPGTTKPTGVWYTEYTDPYKVFTKAGYEVHTASPLGGKSPVDPRSGSEAKVQRIPDAWNKMQSTRVLAKVKLDDYVAVFLAGGHGTMWDFPNQPALTALISQAIAVGKPVGAVCHGPAGLIGAVAPDGKPLVAGRKVNSFTNAEEKSAGMTADVPFLLEDKLKSLGGLFESDGVFREHVVEDRGLVTGQNPASADAVAERMVALLKARSKK
jgi:putative intracellular protease/amidase